MAGGVALNCVANGKILRDKSFKDVWIQPASGDAGGALGGALALWHKELNKPRTVNPKDSMKGSYLGPMYEQGSIEKKLLDCGAKFDSVTEDEMIEQTAQTLSDGQGSRLVSRKNGVWTSRTWWQVDSWVTLVQRKMQKTLNLKVKYRESFRPFAPSVLREDVI